VVNYFGQDLEGDKCRACDVCLGEIEGLSGALVVAQKILSSVFRQGERFGADYTAGVLTGSREDRILANHHDNLSTYGLLKAESKPVVRDWIEQLVEQECVERAGEFGVLKLTDKGRRVLKGEERPLLLEPAKKKPARKTAMFEEPWDGVDRGLFEELRGLRRRLAQQRSVPAYIVFGDAVLRELARRRPSTPAALLRISGVGAKKLEDYGEPVLHTIDQYCTQHSLPRDIR
jgi:ATP-dependent DNA helicase RecQ